MLSATLYIQGQGHNKVQKLLGGDKFLFPSETFSFVKFQKYFKHQLFHKNNYVWCFIVLK